MEAKSMGDTATATTVTAPRAVGQQSQLLLALERMEALSGRMAGLEARLAELEGPGKADLEHRQREHEEAIFAAMRGKGFDPSAPWEPRLPPLSDEVWDAILAEDE